MFGKISAQPHTTLCIQFLNRANNDKNNTLPLGKQICFTIVWGCTEALPNVLCRVKDALTLLLFITGFLFFSLLCFDFHSDQLITNF